MQPAETGRLSTSKLGAIKKVRLADSVYQSLVEAILTGRLAAGSALSEVALAEELGVSRTPVHEAVRRLIIDELIEVLPNRTLRVAQLSRQGIFEVYEMRKLLEPAATKLACRNLSDADLTQMRAELDELKQTEDDEPWARRAIDFDIRFHQQIADVCGNSRLRTAITKHRRLVRAYCRISGTTTNLRDAVLEHDAILSALEQRHANAAQLAMELHIESRYQALLKELPAASAPDPALTVDNDRH